MNTSYHTLIAASAQIEQKQALPPALQDASALLTFLWALGVADWPAATRFLAFLPQQHPNLPPIWGGLLAHLLRLAPNAVAAEKLKREQLNTVITVQLHLQQRLDPKETGLLTPTTDTVSVIALQTYWIWSTQALIDIGDTSDEYIHELVLLNELYVFETNEQFWLATDSKYEGTGPHLNSIDNFLPLFAAIPDQDMAEAMNLQMIAQGFPLGLEKVVKDLPEVSSASVFVLYVGLLEYSMHTAAEQLKLAYAEKITEKPDALEEQAVHLLWGKY